MDLKGLFKKEYIIGVDIGSSSVKIAQFAEREDGLHLIKADLKELKSDDDARGEDEAVSILKAFLKGTDPVKSRVIAVINCPKTALKKVIVPYMPKAELHDGIKLEAKNYFPFSVDNAILDFEITGDIVEKGVRKYEVAVAVSPRKTVEKNLELLRRAGIKPASFIPAAYALKALNQNLFYPSVEEAAADTKCLLDIGRFDTELVILKGKEPAFMRKIPVSGSDFTKALTGVLTSDKGRLALSLPEAEKIKRDVGIPPGDGQDTGNEISAGQIMSMIRTPLEHLVNELHRCFDYYREESGGGKVKSLVLFGGGASLGGLIKHLSEELGMEVKLGDPLEGLKIEKGAVPESGSISHCLALSIGAVLSGGKGINLLPSEIKDETARVIKRGSAEAVITAAILISLFLYIGMKIQLNNFEKRIPVSESELASLQFNIKTAKDRIAAKNILADEPHWEEAFKELSNLIPADIYLQEIRMENRIITMKGIVTSENGEQLLSDFIGALGKGMFKDVKMIKMKDIDKGNEFELNCGVE